MLYRPKFCCNCGEKIERMDWHLTVSRRFCDVCSIENRRFDYAPRIAVGTGALALVFGLGTLWGGLRPIESRPPVKDPATLVDGAARREVPKPLQQTPEQAVPPGQAQSGSMVLPPGGTLGPEQKSVGSKFYCGALTKKGTPCSRKVKVRGARCYQHEGRPEAPPIN